MNEILYFPFLFLNLFLFLCLTTYDDRTVLRNVGTKNSDAGESPKIKNTSLTYLQNKGCSHSFVDNDADVTYPDRIITDICCIPSYNFWQIFVNLQANFCVTAETKYINIQNILT
jgi:hypothetical protein